MHILQSSFTATTTGDVAEYTYQNGNNPMWTFALSSENKENHPKTEALKKLQDDVPYDNFASFQIGDQTPYATIQFEGEVKLHFIEGQLTSRYDDEYVTITLLYGNDAISTNVRVIQTF